MDIRHLALIVMVSQTVSLIEAQTAPPAWDGQKGQKGTAGLKGFQGPPGVAGATGNVGATGFAGDDGDNGSQGPAGQSGGVGISGLSGFQGQKGATGSRGQKGDAGTVGQVGAAGPSGAKGARGIVGIDGEDGSTGSKGNQGVRGTMGGIGPKGAKGVPGSVSGGAQGYRGTVGPKGELGYPFMDQNGQYTDGCIELEGYSGKSCVDSQVCQDMVKEELGQPVKVEGECACQDGSTLSGSSCVSDTFIGVRDCAVDNGGCEQTCRNGECTCADGYTLRLQGNCVDIDECSRDSPCSGGEACINLIGSYTCLIDSTTQAQAARVVGRRILNETSLLAILIWFLILLLIILILLFYVCSLSPLQPRYKAQAPPVVEVQPPIVEYYHHQLPGTMDIPGFRSMPIGQSKMIKAY